MFCRLVYMFCRLVYMFCRLVYTKLLVYQRVSGQVCIGYSQTGLAGDWRGARRWERGSRAL